MKPVLPLAMLTIGIAVGWFGRPLATDHSDRASGIGPAPATNAHASDAKSPVDSADKPTERSSSGRPATPDNAEAQKKRKEAGSRQQAKRMTDIQRRKFDARLEKLTADLKLTAEQQAQVRAGMEKRFEKLGELFASSFDNEPDADKRKSLTDIMNTDALDEATAGVLNDEQKKEYPEFKIKERQNRVDSQALKDLGSITTTLELSSEQRDGIYQVLSEEAAKREDSPKPAGLMNLFAESSGIQINDELGLVDLMEAQDTLGKSDSDKDDVRKKMREAVKQRTQQRIDALRPHLTETQVQQYQAHLEAKSARMLEMFGGGSGEPDTIEIETK